MIKNFAVATGVLVMVLAGCRKDGGAAPLEADAGFPGSPSPSIVDLVGEATAKKAPPSPGTSYAPPERITVPPIPLQDLGSLPKDEQGRTIVEQMYGVRLTVDPNRRDPITAMGVCVGLASGCVRRSEVPTAHRSDACWESVPRCATDHPWTETPGCCPARCPELYRRLRELGYPPLDAARLTMDSSCFNGLREFLRAS